jgi:hypothetical protein
MNNNSANQPNMSTPENRSHVPWESSITSDYMLGYQDACREHRIDYDDILKAGLTIFVIAITAWLTYLGKVENRTFELLAAGVIGGVTASSVPKNFKDKS